MTRAFPSLHGLARILAHPLFCRTCALLITVAYPYLCRIGGFPNIDEGVFGYSSMVYHYNLTHGEALAPLQGLSLWSLLLAWIPCLAAIPLPWFRLADMFAALLAAWLLCAIMQRECGIFSCLIALVFLPCVTSWTFIENGFKNSFFPAWACFFGAILLIMDKGKAAGGGRWLWAGLLTALGIMLRETFFPFALLGLVAAWKMAGFKKALFYCLGGIIGGLAILALIECIAPGSLANIWKGYVDRSAIYETQTGRIWHNFLLYAPRFLLYSAPALAFTAIIGLIALLFHFLDRMRPANSFEAPEKDGACRAWGASFWLSLCLIPLYETLVKIGFSYHFAQSLPGLACLAALFAGVVARSCQHMRFLKSHWIISACLFAPLLGCAAAAISGLPPISDLKNSFYAIMELRQNKWPAEMAAKSIPLRAIDAIQRQLPNGGTVSSSGILHFIYTSSGLLPPLSGSHDADDNYLLGDLSRFYINTGKHGERLRKAILANPPDVAALARPLGTHEPSFPNEIGKILESTGLYEKFAEIYPATPRMGIQHYDWLALDLYRRKAPPSLP